MLIILHTIRSRDLKCRNSNSIIKKNNNLLCMMVLNVQCLCASVRWYIQLKWVMVPYSFFYIQCLRAISPETLITYVFCKKISHVFKTQVYTTLKTNTKFYLRKFLKQLFQATGIITLISKWGKTWLVYEQHATTTTRKGKWSNRTMIVGILLRTTRIFASEKLWKMRNLNIVFTVKNMPS